MHLNCTLGTHVRTSAYRTATKQLNHANAPACRAAGQLWAEFYLCFSLAAANCLLLGDRFTCRRSRIAPLLI